MTEPFEPGSLLADRYRIERRLGEGAVGAVYLAEHIHLGERVAIKVLLPEVSGSAEALSRFEREAKAAAKIKHPNVVAATDFGKTEDGAFFLVLEYVEGESLRDLLLRGPVDLTRSLRILHGIAAGLERAHGHGIVHRDLKPENVMLVQDPLAPGGESVKVLDFGIAKVPTMVGGNESSRDLATQRGLVYGTPEYMSPEQALGEEVDARADLYAIGVMAYELFTGTRPYRHESKVALLGMHVTAPFPSFKERVPDLQIGEDLEKFARKLMEKRKEDRYSDAHAMRLEIERLLGIPSSVHVDEPVGVPFMRRSGERASVLRPDEYPASTGPFERPKDGVRTMYDKNVRPIVDKAREKTKEMVAADPKRAKTVALTIGVGALLLGVIGFALSSGSTGVAHMLFQKPFPKVAPTSNAVDLDAPEGPIADPKAEFAAALSARNGKRGANAAKAWIAKEPSITGDAEFVSGLRGLAASPSGVAVLPVLDSLGSLGVDILYDTAFAEPPVPASPRAKSALDRKDVRAKASPDVDVALALRKAAGCPQKKALLPRAKDIGAARTLKALLPLQSTTGCSGFAGSVRDCYPCLRGGKQLAETVAAVRERAAGK